MTAQAWQQIAVALIVIGAVAFLVRRVVGRRKPRPTAQSFVPLSSLKRPAALDRGDGPSCH